MDTYKKKYKNALERAMKFLNKELFAENSEYAIKHIFPELKELEDGKTRKEIVGYLKRNLRLEWAAWLEKQGEKQQKTPIWKHWKDGIAGNGEGKLIYLIKNGNDYLLSSCLGFECDYIELSKLDNLMLEKQGEQKPVWGEEDEKIVLSIEQIFNCASLLNIVPDKIEKVKSWLKNLKDRVQPQPKQKWSEEDDKMCQETIDWFEKKCFPYALENDNPARESIKWLKSLKERATWKPSDKQMEALDSVIDEYDGYPEFDLLVSLKNDLRKL